MYLEKSEDIVSTTSLPLFTVCVHCVCVCHNLSLITASVAVIALGYKHHQSPTIVTLYIRAPICQIIEKMLLHTPSMP